MELLDRYLQAVRFWLPKAQQKDIIEELGDDIRSQVEDKESAFGRPLNEDEMVSLLRQTGHPLWVAARYQPQQSLIGPALFPLYKFVLKMVTLFYMVPWILVWIALAVLVPSHRADNVALTVLGGWASFWNTTFIIFGIITLAFTLLERFQSSLGVLKKWDPRKLPRVTERKQRVSRVESVFGLVFSIIYVIWWLGLPRYGHYMFGPAGGMYMFGPAGGMFSLNPALRAYFFPALAPPLIVMVQQCVNLFRPQWTWLRAICMLVADAIALGVVASIATVFPYVLIVQPGTEAAKQAALYAHDIFVINQVIFSSVISFAVGIGIALIVHAVQTVREVRRLSKGPRNSAALQISHLL
jgi:MFS family permease